MLFQQIGAPFIAGASGTIMVRNAYHGIFFDHLISRRDERQHLLLLLEELQVPITFGLGADAPSREDLIRRVTAKDRTLLQTYEPLVANKKIRWDLMI